MRCTDRLCGISLDFGRQLMLLLLLLLFRWFGRRCFFCSKCNCNNWVGRGRLSRNSWLEDFSPWPGDYLEFVWSIHSISRSVTAGNTWSFTVVVTVARPLGLLELEKFCTRHCHHELIRLRLRLVRHLRNETTLVLPSRHDQFVAVFISVIFFNKAKLYCWPSFFGWILGVAALIFLFNWPIVFRLITLHTHTWHNSIIITVVRNGRWFYCHIGQSAVWLLEPKCEFSVGRSLADRQWLDWLWLFDVFLWLKKKKDFPSDCWKGKMFTCA